MSWSRVNAQKGKQQPVSPSQTQGRTREAGRVKEFPAGNLATSRSRMAFLRSLCTIPKFRSMVDFIPPMVRIFFLLKMFIIFNIGI